MNEKHTTSNPQSQTLFDPEASEISVLGTSFLNDWKSIVTMKDVEVELHIESADPLLLGHLRLTIPVRLIKSGQNIMDRKTYEALKADEYRVLKYEVEVFDYREGEVVVSDGKLRVAVVERSIRVIAKYIRIAHGQKKMSFTGSVSCKMSDFNIAPPTGMRGTLKTGDEITIRYKIMVEMT